MNYIIYAKCGTGKTTKVKEIINEHKDEFDTIIYLDVNCDTSLKVARQHERITNLRKDFLHKLTYKLIHENQVDTICIEDLAVKNMIKNHKLARLISDVGWSMFRSLLEYKCELYGKNLLVIGRFEPSSKMCSCGWINKDLTLADREWTCPKCRVHHDRDVLAANNIKRFALSKALSPRQGGPMESFSLEKAMK